MDYALIMAGGSGTRLWPLSRKGMPKQLLPLVHGKTLLQLAFERACTLVDPSRIIVCAGRNHTDAIIDQLPGLDEQNLLAEPVGRDSLAAITWSTATIRARDEDAVVAILGADHVISPVSVFTRTLTKALVLARTDPQALVTCGVVPTSPHTGYGYLQLGEVRQEGVFQVERFAEKPNLATAESYLAQGGWWWNSGMFCFRATTFLDQVQFFAPSVAQGIAVIIDSPELIDEIYPQLTKISVDYAVMEPVSQGRSEATIMTVGLDAQWADVGSFPALAEHLAQDQENALEGPVVTLKAERNLIINRSSQGRLVAVCGTADLIIVEDDDVTLVCSKDQAESIKELVEMARLQGERYV
ncbi:MAG: mannose-1-phosphate guanylyltransferase [Propionibacteriaceae bacterium]|nr:mannose-1-phosphate guanylyltransferase [Propionibacteriaceae bacterium]